MKYQVLSLDEYKSVSILGTYDSVDEAMYKIRDLVTDDNVRNSLAESEKERFWTSYYIDIFEKSKLNSSMIYAGVLPDGKKHKAYLFQDGKVLLGEIDASADIRIYLGQKIDDEPWYLQDQKGRTITKIIEDQLVGKNAYFIKAI